MNECVFITPEELAECKVVSDEGALYMRQFLHTVVANMKASKQPEAYMIGALSATFGWAGAFMGYTELERFCKGGLESIREFNEQKAKAAN